MDLYTSSPLRDVESMLFRTFSPEEHFCLDAAVATGPALPLPEVASGRSAFASYTGAAPTANAATATADNDRINVHKRVIELLRRIPRGEEAAGAGSQQGGRGFRHMMRERQRREKMSQCYADLHSILPHVQKGDKNSIVKTAAAYIQELEGRREELRMRNEESIKRRRAGESEEVEDSETTNIKMREANSTSSVDSMIGALRCLKAMDVKARAISCEFSGCELTAVVSIETKVRGENIIGIY